MTIIRRAGRKCVRWTGILAGFLGGRAAARPAAANPTLSFRGGPMRDLVIDLVFWGNFTDTERGDIREYVARFSAYVNGAWSPLGLDPVIRYYGIWAAYQGNWINDTDPIDPSL